MTWWAALSGKPRGSPRHPGCPISRATPWRWPWPARRCGGELEVNLPIGTRRFDYSLRPVFNGRGEVIGVVPEAVDITDR